VLKVRIREFYESEWFKENYDELMIDFWGGEPTLNGNLIIDIMKEFQHIENIGFHIYTNGYNRKRLEHVIDNIDIKKLNIQFSYDGKNINDKFRLTHSGRPTSTQVVENFEYFARKGLNLSLKATVPLKSMTGIYNAWKDYEQLYERFKDIGPNCRVEYAPTIDYVTDLPIDEMPNMVVDFRKEMLMIAKEEIAFVKKYGHHLCTWFDGGDAKSHCQSGASMHAINVDGNSYACHGSLYSPNKEQMASGGNIDDDDFIDKVIKMATTYQPKAREVSDICKGCVATTCMICPVSSLDNSKKDDYFDRWTDRWVNNMCGFYKTFGEIDRTVQAYLDRELAVKPESKETEKEIK
jgi:sulfatase maturation enzyme AslB (radical SAM superfamily)